MSAFPKNYQSQILLALFIVFVMFCVTAIGCPVESSSGGGGDPKADLSTLISECNELLEQWFDMIRPNGDSLTEGDRYVTYNDWQIFDNAIKAARAVFRKPEASDAEIKAAKNSLEAARNTFMEAIVTVALPGEPGVLVQFNASGAIYDGTGPLSGFGTGEKYLIFPLRINLMSNTIAIQAKVKIIAAGGDNGIGFISVDGSERKGYMLTTPGGVKNVGLSNGGSAQGFDSAISNSAGDVYVFKTEISGGKIAHYIYNADTGELITKKDTSTNFSASYGHSATDTVYAAIGGTSVENIEWSEIAVIQAQAKRKYVINELLPQTAIPSFKVDAATARVRKDEQGSVSYTATSAGGTAAAITVTSSDSSTVNVDSFTNGTIKFTGKKTGRANLTVTHPDNSSFSPKIIAVTVIDYPAADSYGVLGSLVYPAVGATNAYTDGELMITFNGPPTLDRAVGFIDIFEKDTGVVADTILLGPEVQKTLGTSNNNINVGLQMTRVEGNSLYITPHFSKLKYNTEYYIAIPSGVITANLNGVAFNGLSDKNDVASWSFKTRPAPILTSPISVEGSQGSTADFRTVYGALEAVASQSGDWTINVAPGTYTELVHYVAGASNQTITINGTDSTNLGGDVIIQYTNGDRMNTGTHPRPSFYFSGANLVLKNITLKNTSTRAGGDPGQAEAIFFANGTGRTLAAYNCSFLSHQDTIQTSGKNWFYKCYIEGDTDYIWGQAETCLLEECKLVSVNDPNKSEKQAVLLVARTGSSDAAVTTVGKGYVLFNSEVTTESGMTTFLARNAGGSGFYDQCAVINTKFINLGTGTISLWRNSSLFYLADAAEHVGFKIYNNTLEGGTFSTAGMPTAGGSVMTTVLFDAEYNSRDKILNRVYNKSGSYQAAEFIWNITSLESTFGAN
jgi:hypothetical protein